MNEDSLSWKRKKGQGGKGWYRSRENNLMMTAGDVLLSLSFPVPWCDLVSERSVATLSSSVLYRSTSVRLVQFLLLGNTSHGLPNYFTPSFLPSDNSSCYLNDRDDIVPSSHSL